MADLNFDTLTLETRPAKDAEAELRARRSRAYQERMLESTKMLLLMLAIWFSLLIYVAWDSHGQHIPGFIILTTIVFLLSMGFFALMEKVFGYEIA